MLQIIPALKQRGLRVSVIKHAHHDFDLGFPGKDSYELRKSGPDQTVICTMTRMATITGFAVPADKPDLQQLMASLDSSRVDSVLVEGYKGIRFPKIKLHRAAPGKPYLYRNYDSVIAIVYDVQPPGCITIPVLDINDIEAVARFIYDDFYRGH